ncbi:MAG: ABC transporter substrate-binding protein [Acidiferrobacteraceae bacterium]|jgi:ABC-type branched-subunit amino acid transport system substrate-binding protein|nr:ABC transporter substrate-binding protein [Acidiferrobacteraceae bacterium]MBT3639170.1 ABC transporter substrate-binding protein [Acidiferrobacteraceae bacterium]MBT3771093.1 ABC transporter substrate-binding protein [Acidiferrobacteraceae bacterium]MBT3973532.1 ABC transporter substrate-binding protein [Acidiferrobacteraceae bacterium]MBT4394399.1 ABC transporter substrate-binding protein [Acidiferrobacteraceae bacterium]
MEKVQKWKAAAGLVTGLAGLLALSGPALAADCPIKIGGLAPLSAPGSVTGGEAMRVAMLLAERDINAAGGVLGCDIEVVIADTEGLPEKARALMEKLITQDGVVAVGGGYHSSVGVAGKDIANDRGIPVVFAETWNDTITGDKQKYIFRIAPLSSWASGVIWKFAAQAPGVKKVVIVTENTDYGIPAAAECEKGLASKGISSTTFGVDIGTQDFAGIVERVKAENPDYLIVLLTGEAGFNYAQQAADAGVGPQDMMFHANQSGLESKAFWENVPDGNLSFMARIGVPETMYNESALKMANDYKEQTGKTGVESYALEAYDSIGVIAQAINEAGSTGGDAIVDALENISHEGTLGRIYFPYGTKKDPSADGKGDEWWHQWPDPAITMVQYQKEGEASNTMTIVYPDVYKTGDAIYVGH